MDKENYKPTGISVLLSFITNSQSHTDCILDPQQDSLLLKPEHIAVKEDMDVFIFKYAGVYINSFQLLMSFSSIPQGKWLRILYNSTAAASDGMTAGKKNKWRISLQPEEKCVPAAQMREAKPKVFIGIKLQISLQISWRQWRVQPKRFQVSTWEKVSDKSDFFFHLFSEMLLCWWKWSTFKC